MKTKNVSHTPGPWEIFGTDEADNQIVIREGGSKQSFKSAIARIVPRPSYCDNQVANARLIAAAPELLEVCKRALPYMEDWASFAKPPIKASLKKTVRVLNAAILKAEGGTI